MNKNLLSGLTSLMLPLASYGMAPMTYGAYQRKSEMHSVGSLIVNAPAPTFRRNNELTEASALSIATGTTVRELVIVDSAVEDKHLILKQRKPGVDVVEITPGTDGVASLKLALAGYKHLSAVHIVAHAEAGIMHLGGRKVDRQALLDDISGFAAINTALREGGDLMIYGCDLARGEAGEDFLEILQQNTHVDIAASVDKTGNKTVGANWELELQKGDIESIPLPESLALKDFSTILAATDGTYDFNGWAGSNTPQLSTSDFRMTARDGNNIERNVGIYGGSVGYMATGAGNAGHYLYVRADGTNTTAFELTGLNSGEAPGYSHNFSNIRIVGMVHGGGTVNSSAIPGTPAFDESFTFGSGQLAAFSGVKLRGFKLYFDCGTNCDQLSDVALFEFRSFTVQGAIDTPPTDSDATLTAGGIVIEPVGLDTTKDTVAESVDVFDFTLSDGGTSDGQAMTVSQVVVKVSGNSTDAERGQVTWRLNGSDVANVPGTYNAGSDTITFSGLSISVADGGNETYAVNAYYNDNTGLTEDRTFILSVDGDNDLTLGSSGTQMGTTAVVDNGTGSAVDVVATQLDFTTQPAGSVSGVALTTQPVVAARDAFGNIDVDFTETISLTEASAGTLSNNTRAAVNGVATFAGVTYTASADQQSFTVAANDQDGVGSDLSTINANAVTSDVVATKLIFITQPAPTSINSGASTNFATDPVVHAVDANNLLDTGYSTNIVLAVTDPNDGTIDGTVNSMSGTGDADGDGTTVTLTPNSGSATFTNLALQYTNSGASNSLALRATSGGLTATNSSTIASLVNSTPSIANLNGDNVAWPGVSSTVSLDSSGDAVISDAELDALNGGNGDYSGASLTVQRAGGANSNDLFGFNTSGAFFTVSGSNLQSGGLTFATFTNSNGILAITFTSSSTAATTALVTNVAQRIIYGNDTPVGDATVRFTLNDGSASTAADVTVEDNTAPNGHSVAFDDGTLDGTEALSTSFTFNSAEVGADYSYTISSSGGGTPVTGSGTVASAAEKISGIDVSGLGDGTLTLSVTLTDVAGNSATAVNDTATLDTSAPSGQSVSFDDANLNGTEATAASFTFASAEVGADYSYTISSSGGGTAVTGSGTVASAAEQISGINISGLGDGTLTLSVVLTDTTGNAASAVTDTATLDATAPSGQSVSFDDGTIDETEVAAVSFTFAGAEVGADYSYTISSNGGGTPVTGSGTLASASDQIGGIDVSGLSDGTLTLSVTLSDAAGNSAGAVIDTATLDTNEAPVATNDTVTTNEDESVLINVLANDTDSEDDLNGASVHVLSPPDHGMVRPQAGSGWLLYTPTKDYSGADSFTYSVEDARGMPSGVATVSLTVNAVNDAPTAVADSVSTVPGQTVNIDLLVNDSDRDDALAADSARLIVYAANGVADVSSGMLTYTPNDGFTGTEKLSYIVLDDAGAASNVADVFINVDATNQMPVTADDTASVETDTPGDINVLTNDTDSDGTLDATSVAITQWPFHGSVLVNTTTGDITYTPDSGFKGSDTFAYVVADNRGSVSTVSTVSVTVGAGEAPETRGDTVRLVSDVEHRINVLGNDDSSAGTTLEPSSVSVITGPSKGSVRVDPVTGDLLYTPDADFNGIDALGYIVQDSNGQVSSEAIVTIGLLESINVAPLANDDWQVVDEDSEPVLTLLSNDTDVDGSVDIALFVTLSAPEKGSVAITGGQVIYTPDADAYGEDRFVYQVADGQGALSEPAVVRLRIAPQAEVPRISGSPTKSVAVGNSYSFAPVAVDPGGQPLTFSIANRPAWASFDNATGRLSGKPGADAVGSTPGIVISVSNGDETASLPAFNLQVTDASGTDTDSETAAPVGSSAPVSDDTAAGLVTVDPASPVLVTPQTTWPTYTNDQPPKPRYQLDYVDQYGERHVVSVTQADASAALPATSGPDAQGNQSLVFTQSSGSEQHLTLAPGGETRIAVNNTGGSEVSVLTSRASDLSIDVAGNGDVTTTTTVGDDREGYTKVSIIQSPSSGVTLDSTYVPPALVTGVTTTHQFDLTSATIDLSEDGTVTASGSYVDGAETVQVNVRVGPQGGLSAVTERSDGAHTPEVSAIVTRTGGSISGVGISPVGEVTVEQPWVGGSTSAMIAADGTLNYDDGSGPVSLPNGRSIAMANGKIVDITRNADPDGNGLKRAAEISSTDGNGQALLSRLEVTDIDTGNAGVFVGASLRGDGFVAQRPLTEGYLSSRIRLDGSSVQQLGGRDGLANNTLVSLLPNGLSLLFDDRAVAATTVDGITFYLEALANGETRHEMAFDGVSTRAISQLDGTRTVLRTNADGEPQVVTSASSDGRRIEVTGNDDGSASHQVTNRAGDRTRADIGPAGTYTTLSLEGTVRSRVRLGETDTCAWAETFSNGETNTGFGRYDEASARCVDIDAPTNHGSPFEAGNRVTIEGEGSNATITIETNVTRPIRF